jgi:putative nucleotidyltransferase with HDIG domain
MRIPPSPADVGRVPSLPPNAGHRLADVASLFEATRALAEASDLDEGLSVFARELTHLLGASGCLVSAYDADADSVTDRVAYVIPPGRLNVFAESYPLDQFPETARVLRELTEITTVAGPECEPAEAEWLAQGNFGASLMVPLVIDDRPFGLVELLDVRQRVFSDEEIRFCRLMADHAGLMLRNARITQELEQQHLHTVGALAAALEAKDAYTGGHAQAIAALADAVGEEVGLCPRDRRALRLGALLHDVGKIGIPERILNKPDRLTDEEYAVMKRHTEIGAEIITGIPGLAEVAALVRWSHERWDGRGYPDGLAGSAIPLGASIIAVCDAYHAMTEDRIYRRALPVEAAVAELRRCSGTQFSPGVVEAFVRVLERGDRRRVRRFSEPVAA